IIATAIAGFFLGTDKADKMFNKQISDLVGRQSAEMIHQAATASLSHRGNMISAIVGIVILPVGATTVFGQLQESLNQIWGVKANPKRSGIALMLLLPLMSFAMVLTIGFLLHV